MNDALLVFLLLTLNISHTFFKVFLLLTLHKSMLAGNSLGNFKFNKANRKTTNYYLKKTSFDFLFFHSSQTQLSHCFHHIETMILMNYIANGSKYSRMYQVKFVENMVFLSKPYHFKLFKGFFPQISLGPFLNTLSKIN